MFADLSLRLVSVQRRFALTVLVTLAAMPAGVPVRAIADAPKPAEPAKVPAVVAAGTPNVFRTGGPPIDWFQHTGYLCQTFSVYATSPVTTNALIVTTGLGAATLSLDRASAKHCEVNPGESPALSLAASASRRAVRLRVPVEAVMNADVAVDGKIQIISARPPVYEAPVRLEAIPSSPVVTTMFAMLGILAALIPIFITGGVTYYFGRLGKIREAEGDELVKLDQYVSKHTESLKTFFGTYYADLKTRYGEDPVKWRDDLYFHLMTEPDLISSIPRRERGRLLRLLHTSAKPALIGKGLARTFPLWRAEIMKQH